MKAEKELTYELLGLLIMGIGFILIIIMLIGLIDMQIRVPQIPNF